MRLFVIVIIVFDILILLTGAFLIFDRFMRRPKLEYHYIFRPFEKDEKMGYAMLNDDKDVVYYALKEESGEDYSVYKFKNRENKHTSMHRVSEMLRTKKSPNNSNKTFYFDNEEIWKHLKERGITFQTTIVNDDLIQYKIKRDTHTIAFMRKRNDNKNKYSLRTYDKDIDLFFLLIFAIALTEEKH